jgi:DNA-directed RNA polymerase specialized sigma24 family protein
MVREDYGADNTSFKAFELCVIKGVDHDQAAAQCNLTRSAVYQAKKRVRQAIKRKMEYLDQEEG